MTTPEHGSLNRYQQHGCKCEQCTEVGRAYAKARVAIRRAAIPEDIEHSRSTYNNWGCRCAKCKQANTNYLKSHRGFR